MAVEKKFNAKMKALEEEGNANKNAKAFIVSVIEKMGVKMSTKAASASSTTANLGPSSEGFLRGILKRSKN